MVDYSKDRITIIPGAGIVEFNYLDIAKYTGASCLHGTKIYK